MSLVVIPVTTLLAFWAGAWIVGRLPEPWPAFYLPAVAALCVIVVVVFSVRTKRKLDLFEGKAPRVPSSRQVKRVRVAVAVGVGVLGVGVVVFVLGPVTEWTAPVTGLNA